MEQDIFGAILISFVISVILCPIVIPYLQKLKFGQYIRKEGPKSHQTKMGTPTMGGLIILSSVVATMLLYVNFYPQTGPILFVTLGFGLIGFLDDYIKVVMKRNLGLRPLTKFILQFVVCTIFIVYILGIFEDTSIYIPFFHKYLELGRPVYAGLIYITVLGTVNGANLTDGIDGLATGVTIIITVFFTVVAWAYNTGLLPITSAVLGALMGFFCLMYIQQRFLWEIPAR